MTFRRIKSDQCFLLSRQKRYLHDTSTERWFPTIVWREPKVASHKRKQSVPLSFSKSLQALDDSSQCSKIERSRITHTHDYIDISSKLLILANNAKDEQARNQLHIESKAGYQTWLDLRRSPDEYITNQICSRIRRSERCIVFFRQEIFDGDDSQRFDERSVLKQPWTKTAKTGFLECLDVKRSKV